MATKYTVRAYCGGPNETTARCHTAEEAIAQADRWITGIPEAEAIVVYGPRKGPYGDYEVYRRDGQARLRHFA